MEFTCFICRRTQWNVLAALYMAAFLHRLRTPGALQTILSEATTSTQKIVIDYSSPNIAKQFHIGNLRSTLLGRYVDRVHRSLGHEVSSVNYLGDWGTQFAIIAAHWPQVRPSDGYWQSCSDVEKIRTLTDCYVVANKKAKLDEDFRDDVRKTFFDMESAIVRGDMSVPTMLLWTDIRSISVRHLEQFYSLLDIHFDRWMSESSYVGSANMLVDELIANNIARKTDDGIFVVDLDDEGKEYGIVRKSDATTLYLSRELAAVLDRDKLFGADRYLYVVDRAQRKHFSALKVLLDRIGRSDLAAKIEHVPYGRVKGLSTRKGRTEAVGDIISRGSELAEDFMRQSKTVKVSDEEDIKRVAQQLSISTIVFNDMKRAKNSEYEFSFQNAFALNQNNALLLQMRHSRLFSIESRNAELLGQLAGCPTVPDGDEDVLQLMDMLGRVDKVISHSASTLEPSQLTVYLIQLSQCVGTVAAKLKVKDQPADVAAPRLLLLSACRHVLSEGMRLLGIPAVNSM